MAKLRPSHILYPLFTTYLYLGITVLLLKVIGPVNSSNSSIRASKNLWITDNASVDLVRHQSSDPLLSCNLCITGVGTLQTLFRSNATYDQLRNASIIACSILVPLRDWDPDLFCTLATDTYAPHLIYVLGVTDWKPREICTLYRNCKSVQQQHRQRSPTAPTQRRHSGLITGLPPPTDDADRPNQPHGQPPLATQQRRSAAQWKADNYTGTIRLVHVTDIHTDYLYAEGSATNCDMPLCCRAEYNGTGSGQYWGDYPCNIPHRTVDLMFSHIANNHRPHIVVNTGDAVQYTVWDQPLDQTIDVDRFITDRFMHHMPASACYSTYGNHDVSPSNLFNPDRPEIQVLNEAVFENWRPLTGFSSDQWTTFQYGAYYTILNRAGLRILSYNSNYGSLRNFYAIMNLESDDYANMKQFMEDTLAEARRNGEKVILMGHHPTGTDEMLTEYSYFITEIQARYSDVIVLHLLGHSHLDSFALVRDFTTDEVVAGVQISSPSLNSLTNINPSYRVFYLDPDTYQPLDMDTYHLDLKLDGNNPTPEIKFVYRATDEYEIADLSPKSFEDLVKRMEVDKAMFHKYRFNLNTRFSKSGTCNERCVNLTLCGLYYTDYERRQQCYAVSPHRRRHDNDNTN